MGISIAILAGAGERAKTSSNPLHSLTQGGCAPAVCVSTSTTTHPARQPSTPATHAIKPSLAEESFDAFYGLSRLAAEALGRFLGGLLQEFAGACDRLHNRLVNRHQHLRRGLLHHHPA